MTTHFPLSGPMSVGGLLARAFRLYWARFGVFLLTAAIFLGPVGVISAVVLMSVRDFSLPFLVPRAIMSILNGQLLSITDTSLSWSPCLPTASSPLLSACRVSKCCTAAL